MGAGTNREERELDLFAHAARESRSEIPALPASTHPSRQTAPA